MTAVTADKWWRIDGFPWTDEWQALWSGVSAFAAVAGVGIALLSLVAATGALWYSRGQLRELIGSNRMLRQSNIELSRPRVSIEFEFYRQEMWDHRTSFIAGLNLVIRNRGVATASDVRIVFDTVPDATPLPPLVRKILSGERRLASLSVGQPLIYRIENFPQGKKIEPDEMSHHNYRVTVEYVDPASSSHFVEVIELSIDPLLFARQYPEPLARISKDVQSLTTAVNGVKSTLRSSPVLDVVHPNVRVRRGKARSRYPRV